MTINTTYEVCAICGCHEEGNLVEICPQNADPALLCEHCAREHYARAFDGSWFDMRQYSMRRDPVTAPHRTNNIMGSGPFYRGPIHLYRLGVFIPSYDYHECRQRWCDRCGSVHFLSELTTVHIPTDPTRPWDGTDDLDVCLDCLNELVERTDLTQCEDCEEFSSSARMFLTVTGSHICETCYGDNYITCERCGEIYRNDDIRWSEISGAYCCAGCIDNQEEDEDDDGETSLIHHYGYTPGYDFLKTDNESRKVLYIGVENESSHATGDDRESHSQYIERVLNPRENESPFYQKCDSSLHKGIELVSMPMSLDYWHEEVYDRLDTYFDRAPRYITEGDSDGLHVHLSRKGMNLGHRIKFGAFFEFCRYEVEKCARRRSAHYAAFLPDRRMNNECCRSSKELVRALKDYAGGRMRCVNWTNAKTVEVRVFRSAHNITDYMAAIELCHAVYQYTKRISWRKLWSLGRDYMLWDSFLTAIADDWRYLDLFDQLEGLEYEQFLPREQTIVQVCTMYSGMNNNDVNDDSDDSDVNDDSDSDNDYCEEVQACNF